MRHLGRPAVPASFASRTNVECSASHMSTRRSGMEACGRALSRIRLTRPPEPFPCASIFICFIFPDRRQLAPFVYTEPLLLCSRAGFDARVVGVVVVFLRGGLGLVDEREAEALVGDGARRERR